MDSENFNEIVMKETQDVLILFTTDDVSKAHIAESDVPQMNPVSCHGCAAISPYFRRVGQRFKELKIDSITIAVMDVIHEELPSWIALSDLPAIAIFPAYDKDPPLRFYSEVGKVNINLRFVSYTKYFKFFLFIKFF